MATFDVPNYIIGNSATITASLSSVLTTLDQALQALDVAPNATTVQFTDTILLTDGTTSNTLNKTGYTTKNTTTNATYYLNFSDASTTGIGAIQKTAGISCNPSTNVITATTFVGALTGTASSATTATTATTASTATTITTTSDNTSGTYYIPFSKTTATTSTTLYLDDTTTALTYNPSTATLTASVFVGGTINGTSGVLLQYNGTTQSSITTNGVQETLLTTQGTATYSSPTLTLVTTASAPYPTTYGNIITFSGSAVAQTISAITVPTNMPVNAMYYCYITNSNTSLGAITINATSLGTGIKTTYTSPVVIPISGFALGTLTKVGSSAFVWSVNVVA